jgi:hypothetical protein
LESVQFALVRHPRLEHVARRLAAFSRDGSTEARGFLAAARVSAFVRSIQEGRLLRMECAVAQFCAYVIFIAHAALKRLQVGPYFPVNDSQRHLLFFEEEVDELLNVKVPVGHVLGYH